MSKRCVTHPRHSTPPAVRLAWFGSSRLATGTVAACVVLGALSPAQANQPLLWPQFFNPFPMVDQNDVSPETRPAPQPARSQQPRRTPAPRPATATKPIVKPKGPLIVTISLQKQSMKVFDDNGLFAESKVSTGKRSNPTPTGVFSVIQKNRHHRSNIYSNAPMPYMQRLTWSGIALHAGALPGYPASQGCIRMPTAFSAQLWQWTRRGARVIVAQEDTAPQLISHPLLPTMRDVTPPAFASETVAPNDIALPGALGLRPTIGAAPVVMASFRTADANFSPRGATPLLASDAPMIVPAAAFPAKSASGEIILPELAPAIAPAPKRTGPVSVFISRKDSRLYARQDFAPLLDEPIIIEDSSRPLGTHVFTARRDPADRNRFIWSVVTVGEQSGKAAPVSHSPADALSRLRISETTMARIASDLVPGASIIVADQGLKAGETGKGTEFVLVMP